MRADGSPLPIHLLYLVMAIPFALLISILTPPMQVPDEVEHYLYARAIASGSILPKPLANGGIGGYVPDGEEAFIIPFASIVRKPTEFQTRARIDLARSSPVTGGTHITNYWGAANYPPIAYAVPSAAIVLAGKMGLDRHRAFHMGRAANGLFVILTATLAIYLLPAGKSLLAMIMLLPSTLSQSASFSTDAYIFALVALICALVARESLKDRPRSFILALIFGLIACVAMVRLPAITLLAPALVLALRRSRSWAVLGTGIVVLPVAVWLHLFVLTEAQVARVAALGNVSSGKQLAHLLASPAEVINIARTTFEVWWYHYFQGAIGILGWLELYMGDWFYNLVAAGLLALAVLSIFEAPALSKGIRIAFLAAVVAGSGFLFGALYLTWTPVGSAMVVGVQGRYFVPFLMMLVLVFPSRSGSHRNGRGLGFAQIGILGALYSVSVVHVVWVIVTRYYLT